MLRRAAFIVCLGACSGSGSGSCPVDDANANIDLSHCAVPESDYTVDSSAIEDGWLHMVVTYRGGCSEHEFIGTYPMNCTAAGEMPVIFVSVRHDSHGDPGNRLITKDLYFDLDPVYRVIDRFGTCELSVNRGPYTSIGGGKQSGSAPTASPQPMQVCTQ